MKNIVILSLTLALAPAALLCAAASLVTEAMADENPYYLELGKEINGEDAVRDWQVLSAKFPRELGKLQFLPESFIDAHNTVTRLQAGPIQDKAKAEAICNKLFKKNTPCFVIEGLERPTADEVARAIAKGRAANALAATTQSAPAMAAAPAQAAETTASAPSPANTSAPAPEAAAASAPASASDSAAKSTSTDTDSSSASPVVLAQAPMPLPPPLQASPASSSEPPAMQPITNTDTAAPADTAVSPVKEEAAQPIATPAPAPAETASAESSKKDIILPWLRQDNAAANVEVDEAIRVPLTTAQNDAEPKPILNAVKTSDSMPSNEIKEVAKPAPANTDSGANEPGWLNVQAFSNEAQASNFWDIVHNAVPAQAAGLRVRVIHSQDPDDSKVTLNVGPFPSRSSALNFCNGGILAQNSALLCQFTENEPEGIARLLPSRSEHSDRYAARRQMLQERRADTQTPNASASDTQSYWVQVASGDNEIEALQMWEKLRTDNADILSNVRSSVSAPLMGSSGYQVKIGPLDTNSQAVSMCKTLKSRGINCSIFSNK